MTLHDWLELHPPPVLARIVRADEEVLVRIQEQGSISRWPIMAVTGLGTIACTLLGAWGIASGLTLGNRPAASAFFVSAVVALAIGLQFAVVCLPFLAAFGVHRLRSQRVGTLTFLDHTLVCADPDGTVRHTVSVHDLQDVWRSRDAFGALIVMDTAAGLIALRAQESQQAGWICQALRVWHQQRARPPGAEDEARVVALRQLAARHE